MGLAQLFLDWSRRPSVSTDEATEYLEKAEEAVQKGIKIADDRSSLLNISAEIQRELGNRPERLSRLRQAVDSNSANAISRYLLGRAYREEGQPRKTIATLDPIIKNDFKNVRAYVEYVRAMIDIGESISKCSATLSQCRLDGESDPAFVGLYGAALHGRTIC